jgi:hypothetical protein
MKDTLEKPRKSKKKPPKSAKPPTLAAELSDPWRDWQPQWQAKTRHTPTTPSDSPHDLQECHAPTQPVRISTSGARSQTVCRRRIVDARLWESFDDLQQQAAIEIAATFERLNRGLGFASSDWQRLPGSRQAGGDGHTLLVGPYIDWTKACAREKISHSMTIDILCFGISCTALDRDRRVRAGTSRSNLMSALTLYAKLRGWHRR